MSSQLKTSAPREASERTRTLTALDRAHVWHPFTPMQQWREEDPLIIERAEGVYLYDTEGRRYLDGVSSLWCNIHGHRVPEIDAAIRQQLDRVAHTTLLGLASPPSIELAARLAALAPGTLDKVFFSDAGATALEAAFKMAVGYWFHRGQAKKNRFIAMTGGYHGDTVGSMSVGFSELFHRPFASLVFETSFFPAPDACRPPDELRDVRTGPEFWPSEDPELGEALKRHSLNALEQLLEQQAETTAAIVLEPLMQGASGMVCQPPGFVRGVADLAARYNVLFIADEVAVGFGRTGRLLACEHEDVKPDLLCLAKGLTGGYLPVAATLATPEIESAFCGPVEEKRTLYHGHTYTGNALGCAAALACLDLFETRDLLNHIAASAEIVRRGLEPLRAHPNVLDIRQRGLMLGIELCQDRQRREPFDFSKRTAAEFCVSLRERGIWLRPLGDVLIVMPIPATPHVQIESLITELVSALEAWTF